MKVRIDGIAETGEREFVLKDFEDQDEAQKYVETYCPWTDIQFQEVKRMKARVRLYSKKHGKKLDTIERIVDNEKVAIQWATAQARSQRAGYMIVESLPLTTRPDEENGEDVERIDNQEFEYEDPE